MDSMKWVYICSPYRGDVEKNVENAALYTKRALMMGCAVEVPHLSYTLALDDSVPEEREIGILAGLEKLHGCDEIWVFGLENPSEGMKREIAEAREWGIPVKDGFAMTGLKPEARS